jgi:hypothetical protein
MRSPKGEAWWAHKGSNLGPLPCEGNALPLSYAPGRQVEGQSRDLRSGGQGCQAQYAAKSSLRKQGPGTLSSVMPALVAGIHVLLSFSGGQDVDHRDKPGDDGSAAIAHHLTRFAPPHLICPSC